MLSNTKILRVGIVALGMTALAAPALAQTGNPNNPTGSEIRNNIPPKGNVGTSGNTTGAARGHAGPVAPGPSTTGQGGLGGPAARDSNPSLGAAPSEVPRPGPKGNIGGN